MAFNYGGMRGGGRRLPTSAGTEIATGVIGINLNLMRMIRQLAYAEQMMKTRLLAASIRAGQQSGHKFAVSFHDRAKSHFNRIGQRLFSGLVSRAAEAMGSALATAGWGVKIAGEMETAEIAMQTLLQSMERGTKLFQEVKRFAIETPFDFPELRDAAKILAIKLPGENIISTLKMLGDVSSGTGADITELAFAYEKIYGSSRVLNYSLRQFERRGIPIYRELSNQLGVSQMKIFDMAKKGEISFKEVEKAFIAMTSHGGNFFEGTARKAFSMEGQLSKLADVLQEIGRQVGESLRPAVEMFTQFALVGLPKLGTMLQDFFANITSERFLKWATSLAEILGDLIDQGHNAISFWRKAQAGLASHGVIMAKAALNQSVADGDPIEDQRAMTQHYKSAVADLVARFPDQYRQNKAGDLVTIEDTSPQKSTKSKLLSIIGEMNQAAIAYRDKKAETDKNRREAEKARDSAYFIDQLHRFFRSGPYKYTDEWNTATRFAKAIPGGLMNTLMAMGQGVAMAGLKLASGKGTDLDALRKKSNDTPGYTGGFSSFQDLNRSIQDSLMNQSVERKIEKNTARSNELLQAAGVKLGQIFNAAAKWSVFAP